MNLPALRLLFIHLITACLCLQARMGICGQTATTSYSYTHYSISNGLPSSEIHDLYQNPVTGLLWIATDRGLVKFDGYDFTTYTVDDGLTDNVVLRFTPDDFENLWCHTLNNQLFYIDKKGKFQLYKFNRELNDTLKSYSDGLYTAFLYYDKNQNLYLSPIYSPGNIKVDKTGKINFNYHEYLTGVKRLNFFPDNGYCFFSKNSHSRYSYSVNFLIHTFICKVSRNFFVLTEGKCIRLFNGTQLIKEILPEKSCLKSGRLDDSLFWVSYIGGGVDVFNLEGEPVFSFLPDEMVSDVIKDHEGGIWFATLSNGLFHLKNTDVKTLDFNPTERLYSITSCAGKLFLGYYNGDIFTFDPVSGTCKKYTEFGHLSLPVYLECDPNRPCLYLCNNDLFGWTDQYFRKIFTHKGGVRKVNEQQNTDQVLFASYVGFVTKEKETAKITRVGASTKDITCSNGQILFTTNEGLFTYQNHTVKKIDQALLNYRIDDLDNFRNGIVCASLGGGLIFYNADTLFSLKKENGLLSDLTTEVFVQSDSVLWVATSAGASKIVIDKKYHYTISGYTMSDGLASNEVVDFDITPGILWIATKKGLNFVDVHQKMKHKNENLFLSIPKIILNGREITDSLNDLQLPYNCILEVFFNAISFSRNQSIVYRYMLFPGNKWTVINTRSIVFSTLQPGEYVFKIQASTDGTQWSRSKKIFFHVSGPFWKTWWFVGLIVLAIAALFFFVFFYRLKQQKLKTNTLEMEMKAFRSQMNPHFIFNSLASIQSFILKGNAGESNKYLTKFSKLIRGVLENSNTNLIPLRKELDLLQIYIELEQLRTKPFDYLLQVDPAIDPATVQVPPLIFQPFVENAIWHGFESLEKKGILRLNLTIAESRLYCVLQDNGVGRNEKQENPDAVRVRQKSYGIEITRDRIVSMKKTYHIETGVVIVDLKNNDGSPAGTRIEIQLPIIT